MYIMSLLCLTSLRIINAIDECEYKNGCNYGTPYYHDYSTFDRESCLFIEKHGAVDSKRTPTFIAYIHQILSAKQCKLYTSTSNLRGPEQMKCNLNSSLSLTFERICRDNKYTYSNISVQCTILKPDTEGDLTRFEVDFTKKNGCSSIVADPTVAITCPSNTAVNTDEKLNHDNGDKRYSNLPGSTLAQKNSMDACKEFLICTVLPVHKLIGIMNLQLFCKVVKPVDDRTTETHVVKSGGDRTTECHGRNSVSGQDTNMDSYGIPDYVFIVGGTAGVLLVICVIVGVFLLRKRNCSEFRNTQMTSNDQVMPTVNPTYTPAGRPNKHENHHQAHLVNAPGGSNLSTTPAVYFDNRTDDKAIKLCPIQQLGIQTNQHESNTYSHLRTTTDDSDDTYDHTVRNAVRNTCDGDYDIAHIRITEDGNDVSGNYHHSLTNKEDPTYT